MRPEMTDERPRCRRRRRCHRRAGLGQCRRSSRTLNRFLGPFFAVRRATVSSSWHGARMSVSILSLGHLSDAPLDSSRQCQIPRSLQKQKNDRRGHVIIGFLILHMFVTSTFLNHVSASSLKFITMEIEVFSAERSMTTGRQRAL